MKLTLIQRNAFPDAAACQAVFSAPGGTLGRGAENDLVLRDETGGICRVQAVVRLGADAGYLHNLSGMSHVSINDKPIRQGQELPLAPGDMLRIGPYALEAVAGGGQAGRQPSPPAAADAPATHAVDAPAAPPPSPAIAAAPAGAAALADSPQAPVDESPESGLDDLLADLAGPAESAPTASASGNDVFSGLFGPGTLPVGSAPDVAPHPFDMASAQSRNAEDPLAHLPRGDANVAPSPRDPLELFQALHGGDDVFADQTPSTLPARDPLAPLRRDPVSDVLRPGRETAEEGATPRDHLRESGSYLRPATARKQPDSDQG